MSFYQLNLGIFAAGNAYLLYRQYQREQKPPAEALQPLPDDDTDRDVELELPEIVAASKAAVSKFKWDFFLVYALAVAADWLQVRQSSPLLSHTWPPW